MTLYELSKDYEAFLMEYEDAEDEGMRQAILADINTLQDQIGDKGESYARIIRNKEREADAYRAEAERLTKLARSCEGVVNAMKGQLLTAMNVAGVTKLRTGIGTFYAQRNPWSVDIQDADAVPKEYHVPQPDKIDKAAILRAFKSTGEIPSGTDIKQDTGLRFR